MLGPPPPPPPPFPFAPFPPCQPRLRPPPPLPALPYFACLGLGVPGAWGALADGGWGGHTRRVRQSEKMDKCIASLVETLGTLRTGRANPAMLDRIIVDYYGAPTPLQSLAGVTCPDAQTVQIQPFDQGAIKDIERAIIDSDTGFTPNNDGKVLRINVPALTAERRKEMAKMCGKMGEEGKVALRNVRRECMTLVKELEAGEDETRAMEAEVEKAAKEYGKKVDQLVKDKEKEITSL